MSAAWACSWCCALAASPCGLAWCGHGCPAALWSNRYNPLHPISLLFIEHFFLSSLAIVWSISLLGTCVLLSGTASEVMAEGWDQADKAIEPWSFLLLPSIRWLSYHSFMQAFLSDKAC